MDERLRGQLEKFLRDERPALEELRRFVGGELSRKLDLSSRSLELLDRYLESLIRNPSWKTMPYMSEISPDIEKWLTVRIAYYLGAVIRERFGSEWYLSSSDSPVLDTPVLRVAGVELSPLQVAAARMGDNLEGGLPGVIAALDRELPSRAH